MSVNKYMHPRNIYKTPPNFKQLALDFPEFRQHVKLDITGKIIFDFTDLTALRALTYTLLNKDFNLSIEIPLNRLIPTVPLRLNYILWIEDLLSVLNKKDDIKGIDIGTGASCIYPLLAARKNSWSMLATEVDKESFLCAKQNVEKNDLQKLIEVVQVNEGTILKGVKDDVFDFCMCNPPFFGSIQELNPQFNARKPDRPKPKNSFCGSVNEVVVQGGEVDFINKLIYESKELGEKVKIYTTMIGHKKNLPRLKKLLREVSITSFKETEFCQGNTTRWGLSWTFCKDFDLKKSPDFIKQLEKVHRSKEPLFYQVPFNETDQFSLENVCDKLLKMLEELQMNVEEVSRIKTCLRYFVTAFSNTWSNQRRKRREQLKKRHEDEVIPVTNQQSSLDTVENCNNNEIDHSKFPSKNDDVINTNVSSPGKRIHEDSLDGTLIKKLKLSDSESAVFFKFTIAIRSEQGGIFFELDCKDDSNNRDYLHQILQYIKNNLRLTDEC